MKFHKGLGHIQRFIGVEIELSDFNPNFKSDIWQVVQKWNGVVKDDSSIDPDDSYDRTMEIATAPACGNKFRQQINEICAVLKQAKANANVSCGLHIHVDARDFTPDDILKTKILWTKIERQMLKMVPSHRRDNDFCVPHSDNQFIQKLQHDMIGTSLDFFNNDYHDGFDKYRSLNFGALLDHQTLENRLHQGTTNAQEIIKWGELNAKMVEFAKKSSIPYLMKKKISIKDFI